MSLSPKAFEDKLERLCLQILQKSDAKQNEIRQNDEFWEQRNAAVLEMTSLVSQLPRAGQEFFNTNVFRLLKDPVRSLISDLRSQQVRDTCLFLSALASAAGDQIKLLLREVFPTILEAMKQPHKVISGYIDNCILSMIRNANFKVCIPMIVSEIKESKSKMVRENCIEYVNEVLLQWDLQDKDMDPIEEAVKMGLEEASVRGREVARLAYLNLRDLSPKRAERIKLRLSTALQAKLTKAETDHDRTVEAAEPTVAVTLTTTLPTLSSVSTEDAIEAIPSSPKALLPRERMSSIRKPLRSPKPDVTATAVTSIQALVRGAMTRRKSMSVNEVKQEEDAVDATELDNDADVSFDFGGMIEAMIADDSPKRKGSPLKCTSPVQPKASSELSMKKNTPKTKASTPTNTGKTSSNSKPPLPKVAKSGFKSKKLTSSPSSRPVIASPVVFSIKKESTPSSGAKSGSKKIRSSPTTSPKTKAIIRSDNDSEKFVAVLKMKLSQTM